MVVGRRVCAWERVKAILVKFDSSRVGNKAQVESQYKQRYPEAVSIYRYEVSFQVGRGRGIAQWILLVSFDPCLGLHYHIQWTTLDQTVVLMEG